MTNAIKTGNKIGKGVSAIYFISFASFGLSFISSGASIMASSNNQPTYEKVSGKVTSSKQYEYTVNDETYTGSSNSGKLNKGDSLTVYYNPKNPNESRLDEA